MKKILSILALAAVLSSSLAAKCSEESVSYSAGYQSGKKGMETNPGMDAVMAGSYFAQSCNLDCTILIGKEKIEDHSKCYQYCLDGAKDAVGNRKPKMTCTDKSTTPP